MPTSRDPLLRALALSPRVPLHQGQAAQRGGAHAGPDRVHARAAVAAKPRDGTRDVCTLIASRCELELARLASLELARPLGAVPDYGHELDRLDRQLAVWDSALRQLAEHSYVQCAEEGQLIEAARGAIGAHARASRNLATRALRQMQALEDLLERDVGESITARQSGGRPNGSDGQPVGSSAAPPAGSAVDHFTSGLASGAAEASYPQAAQLLTALLARFTPSVRARMVREVDKALHGQVGADANAAALRGSLAEQASDAARGMAELLNQLSDAQRTTAINVLFVGLSADATRHLRGYFAEEPAERADAEAQCELLNRYSRWEPTEGAADAGPDGAQPHAGSASASRRESTAAAATLSRAPSITMSRSPSAAGAQAVARRQATADALRRGSANAPLDAHASGGVGGHRKESRMSAGGLPSSRRESHASAGGAGPQPRRESRSLAEGMSPMTGDRL